MKHLQFFVFFFLFAAKLVACSCITGLPSDNFKRYDNVFTAKIIEIIDYYDSSEFPKEMKVEVVEVFKGKSSQIINIERYDGMCHIPKPTLGTSWLFYISNNDDDKYSIGACNSSSEILNGSSNENDYDYLGIQQLRNLKEIIDKYGDNINLENIILNNPTNQIISLSAIDKIIHNFERNDFLSNHGFYLVKFLPDCKSIKDIEIINSMSSKIDIKIIDYYKNMDFWKSNIKIIQKQESCEDFIIPIIIQKPFKYR